MSPRDEFPLPWTTTGGGLRQLSHEMCGKTVLCRKVLRFKLHANSVRIPYLKNTFEPLASRRLKQSSQTDPQVEVNFLSGRSDRLHYELTDLLMQRPTSL